MPPTKFDRKQATFEHLMLGSTQVVYNLNNILVNRFRTGFVSNQK